MSQRSAVAVASIVLASLTIAQAAPRKQQPHPQHAAPAAPGDKRDRTVASPGTPFHGKAYWQAAAQCGGIYFKVGTFYSESAIKAKVVKPDPAAYASLQKSADVATRTATAFFEAAEHFLIADRKLTRDEAVLTYDAVATAAGERVKSLETSEPVLKPCPVLYQACRATYPQMCNDKAVAAN
jgi:hypothetical protein